MSDEDVLDKMRRGLEGPTRILLVDDDPGIRDAFTLRFGLDGVKVDGAADGEEGLAKFIDPDDYDLVMLDLNLPKMSGRQVFEKIRLRDKDVPIVIVTGQAMMASDLVDDEGLVPPIIWKPMTEPAYQFILSLISRRKGI